MVLLSPAVVFLFITVLRDVVELLVKITLYFVFFFFLFFVMLKIRHLAIASTHDHSHFLLSLGRRHQESFCRSAWALNKLQLYRIIFWWVWLYNLFLVLFEEARVILIDSLAYKHLHFAVFDLYCVLVNLDVDRNLPAACPSFQLHKNFFKRSKDQKFDNHSPNIRFIHTAKQALVLHSYFFTEKDGLNWLAFS